MEGPPLQQAWLMISVFVTCSPALSLTPSFSLPPSHPTYHSLSPSLSFPFSTSCLSLTFIALFSHSVCPSTLSLSLALSLLSLSVSYSLSVFPSSLSVQERPVQVTVYGRGQEGYCSPGSPAPRPPECPLASRAGPQRERSLRGQSTANQLTAFCPPCPCLPPPSQTPQVCSAAFQPKLHFQE